MVVPRSSPRGALDRGRYDSSNNCRVAPIFPIEYRAERLLTRYEHSLHAIK